LTFKSVNKIYVKKQLTKKLL